MKITIPNTRIARTVLSAALLCCSLGVHAESLPVRAATGVGAWIAAQGNAALDQIADDLRREIDRQIKPLLPQPVRPTPAPSSTD